MMAAFLDTIKESPWWLDLVLYTACVAVAFVLLECLVGRDDQ